MSETPSNPVITVRRMAEEDLEEVYAIDVLSFTLPWSLRAYRHEVKENPNSRPTVALVTDSAGQSRVGGMVVLWVFADEGEIGTIAVHPEYRRMGIGRLLLAQALRDALAANVERVFLEVRRGNLSAQALYRQAGFVEIGVRPKYYVDNNEDALLMSADLNGPDQIERFARM